LLLHVDFADLIIKSSIALFGLSNQKTDGEGSAVPGENDLINLFSKEWEDKCREALQECCELDKKKIPEAEKWWRVKQLLKEMTRPERRRRVSRQKLKVEPIVENEAMRERRKLDFHSQEWTEKCAQINEKCAQIENSKIPETEKLWQTKQLLKELAFVDKKRRAK